MFNNFDNDDITSRDPLSENPYGWGQPLDSVYEIDLEPLEGLEDLDGPSCYDETTDGPTRPSVMEGDF